MPSVVFDASALLALLRDEAGADAVAAHIGDGIISAVNYQEVIKELIRRGIPLDGAVEMLDALHLDVHSSAQVVSRLTWARSMPQSNWSKREFRRLKRPNNSA